MIFLSRLFVSILTILVLLAWTSPFDIDAVHSNLDEQEELIRQRIPSVVTIVNPVYNPAVRSYLDTYIYRRPEQTACMIGWAAVYFPMFEKALQEEGLPADLKYLSIVESALNPVAISRSGAGGLWQFMKPTARECGLKISSYVDERMDPEKSTKAAARYLKQLYDTFGNWELVMAAYNAGPGRVRSAIKRSGTTDYWKLCRYLPVETRSYVPGFIAASYLMNYHDAHDVIPVYPEMAMGEMDTVYVYEGMSIGEAAKRSGLSIEDLKRLNPVYVRNYIPTSPAGYPLYLPPSSVELFNSGRTVEIPALNDEMLSDMDTKIITVDGQTFKVTTTRKDYVVRSGDNLYSLAQRNHCTVRELMTWNDLHDSHLNVGQHLEIRFTTKELVPSIVEAAVPPPTRRTSPPCCRLETLGLDTYLVCPIKTIDFNIDPVVKEQSTHTFVLQRRQSVRQVLSQQGLTAELSSGGSVPLSTGDVVRLK